MCIILGAHLILHKFSKLLSYFSEKNYQNLSITQFVHILEQLIIIFSNEVTRKKDATVRQSKEAGNESGVGTTILEKRFAFSLLEKLLEYVDKAAYNMKNTKPASRFSRRHSFCMSTEDVKFFGKVQYWA